MKANVVDRILIELMEDETLNSLVEIHTANRMYTFNTHTDECGDSYSVSIEDNVLMLINSTGTNWIDCDCITSIEI